MTESDDERLWAAVADPSRRKIIDAVLMLGEATQTAIAAEVPFTRQAVAKHLGVLHEVGLVSPSKQGREVRYRLELDRLEDASTAMLRVSNRWDKRMAKIKRMAEAAHKAASVSSSN